MRTGRKLQNRERVEKCKETLDQLSRFMGDINEFLRGILCRTKLQWYNF